MKRSSKLAFTLLAFGILFTSVSCKKDNLGQGLLDLLDNIPADKYYATDPLQDDAGQLYGVWEVTGTSGGITGGGYTQDFDYLLVKPNAIFGIVRNDSLLATGKVELQDSTATEPLVHFLADDTEGNTPPIQLLQDYEKFLIFQSSDSLHLFSPCCDRFDTHLKKIE